jgi:hypothetical protein
MNTSAIENQMHYSMLVVTQNNQQIRRKSTRTGIMPLYNIGFGIDFICAERHIYENIGRY